MLRTYVPVLAGAALAFAGCGGNDDNSSAGNAGQRPAAQTRLTHGEYAAQGNKICKDTEAAQKPFDDRINKVDRGDLETAAPIIEDALKTTRVGYRRLHALSPPAADQARADAYLTAVDQRLDSLARLAEAARNGDRAGGKKAATEIDTLGDAQQPLGTRLGLDECSDTF
jgi:hypothetical protein